MNVNTKSNSKSNAKSNARERIKWCRHYSHEINVLYAIAMTYLHDDETLSKERFEEFIYDGCSIMKIQRGIYKRVAYNRDDQGEDDK